MVTRVQSRQEYYDIYKNTAQSISPQLTDFSDGAINDAQAGSSSSLASEISTLIIREFLKTLLDSANGPEVTGGPDDLQTLIVDHFGDTFARPQAEKSVGVGQFSRLDAAPGDVVIPAGTIVTTETDANGENIRYATILEVTLVGLTINASIEAVVAGTAGNKDANEINQIESTLTDPEVTFTNAAATSGGEEIDTDEEYREFARNQLQTLKGASASAIKAVAENVPGVEFATPIEKLVAVIEWDIGGGVTVGDFFRIPICTLYVADANGTANDALLALVDDAVKGIRACGAKINIIAAVAVSVDWNASLLLNPAGPNYTTLLSDTTMIEDSMTQYLNDLDIGTDFVRSAATTAIMEIWGPTGTGDLQTNGFTISVPAGDVSIDEDEKAIAGTIGIS